MTLTAAFHGDFDQQVLLYEWDWEGDGVYDFLSHDASLQHIYSVRGDYTPTVRGTDNWGASTVVSTTIAVNDAPVAQLSANPTEGYSPLTVDFDASDSFDPDGNIVEYWFKKYDSAPWDKQTSPLWQCTYNTGGGTYDAVVRVIDVDGGWAETTAAIWEYKPQHVWMEANVNSGSIPLTVSFTATATDDDGTIVSYEYDLDGDGTYEIGPSLNATASTTYTSVAIFTPRVRVTDSQGLQARSWGISILAFGWAASKISGVLGTTDDFDRDALLIGGNPAVAFTTPAEQKSSSPTASLLRAADSQGSSWLTPLSIDQTKNGDFGLFISSTIGMVPFMACSLFTRNSDGYYNDGIRVDFIAAQDAAGTAWRQPQVIDQVSGWNVNAYRGNCALQMINGAPALAYMLVNEKGSEIRYARALDAQGTAWAAPVMVPATSNHVIADVSLIDANGHPAISYVDIDFVSSGVNVCYCRALDANGANWDAPVSLYGPEYGHLFASDLVTVQDNPALAVTGYESDAVHFLRAADAAGATWNAPQQLYQGQLDTMYPAMVLISGMPTLVFSENIYGSSYFLSIKYCEALDASGAGWAVTTTIAFVTNVDRESEPAPYNLLELNGRAALLLWNPYSGDDWLLKE